MHSDIAELLQRIVYVVVLVRSYFLVPHGTVAAKPCRTLTLTLGFPLCLVRCHARLLAGKR